METFFCLLFLAIGLGGGAALMGLIMCGESSVRKCRKSLKAIPYLVPLAPPPSLPFVLSAKDRVIVMKEYQVRDLENLAKALNRVVIELNEGDAK
jgi:predicted ABC-class ATPase